MVTRQTSYELHGQQAYGNGSLTLQAVAPVFFTEPPYWSITVRGNGTWESISSSSVSKLVKQMNRLERDTQ